MSSMRMLLTLSVVLLTLSVVLLTLSVALSTKYIAAAAWRGGGRARRPMGGSATRAEIALF
eukprot:2501729-Pyramimonas_sp.AAC.1